ncbi:transporter substrate-binding domain-containing protein [Undibacterium sp. TS12]|uniref:transporter substrate-binding domain-containing protein n=1 Tax=Undibacterium sp. TS12 TaxID=2908202 RepID=UPI001F4D1275|nr:transporter substrate-binding domain-containing protein [Undibacterium sp. TS12]MCH8619129.1 transporter substrate-binding domain-containing protein [Undibacterium sp. TS12]
MLPKVLSSLFFCLVCGLVQTAQAVNLYLTEVAPFAFFKEGRKVYDGINVRIANELRRRSGVAIELVIVPSSRHILLFPADTEAYSISQAENFTDRDGSILSEVTQFPIIVVAQRGAVLKNYEDLINLSSEKGIGMMRRLSYGNFAQDERVKKVEINTLENGLRMLEIGRIAGVVGSQPAILAAAEKIGLRDILSSGLVISYGSHVMRVRPEFASSPAARAISSSLLAMKNDGSITRILDDFMKDPRSGSQTAK